MLYSMTGFGKGLVENNGLKVEVVLKSENSRYTEFSIKLPREFYFLEPVILEKLKKEFYRGRITATVEIGESKQCNQEYVFFSSRNLEDFYSELVRLKDRFFPDQELNLSHLLKLSDFPRVFNEAFPIERIEELVRDALQISIENLKEMKQKEGESLSLFISRHLAQAKIHLENIEKMVKPHVQSVIEKARERIKILLNDIKIDENRIAMEVAILAERYDITEECERLRSHFKQAIIFLESNESAGKKLNFLIQEMNREANTIGSKASTAEITFETVYLKEELEKIREQIQNIE